MTIRRAAEADIPLLRRLAGEAFPATYGAILSQAQLDYMMQWMYSEEALKREMQEGFAWFVASVGDKPCGYLSIQQEGEDLFHLQKIYLLPQFQGQGDGAELFRHAVAYIHSVHPALCRMELNVNRHNGALHFYEKMGMKRVREGDFSIGGGYFMNDYIMALEIK